MAHKLLIVCYTFPPFDGIGGRRWAKFCKYLHLQGVSFDVIAAQRQSKSNNWLADIEPFKNRVTYIPSGFPEILASTPKTIIQKIKYKIALFIEKYLFKGNPYDYSRHWKKQLQHALSSKLAEGHTTVIYSMLPFRGAAYTIQLKKQFPNVQFVLDVRDPWSNNHTVFGFDSLSVTKRNFEKEIEQATVLQYHKVIAVSKEMNEYFENAFGVDSNKLFELKNGFDTDDNAIAQSSTTKNIVFVGTLYQKAQHVFMEFIAALNAISITNPEVLSTVKFTFYGSVPAYFYSAISGIDCIAFKGKLAQADAAQVIANAQATMLFLANDTNYSFSTKFYEYVCNKKPVLVFAKSGITSKFVQENGIGMELPLGNMEPALSQALSKVNNESLQFNSGFNTSIFELEHLTNELIKIIEL